MKYAFRCRNCGRLDTSEHAAEAMHPRACCVCGQGKDWDYLWKLSAGELSEFSLTKEDVKEHVPWHPGPSSNKNIQVSAEDGIKSKNRT
jgi:hypothetical protein